jgi:TolB-like protein/Tfp pilus assembly protein PilF
MKSLIDELRRRNVFRLAATYALAAWILIEAGSVLLPTFGVPDWFFRVYVLVIFAGFVVALVLGWVFEITPEGVRFDHEVDRSRQVPVPRGRSNLLIIGLLVLALGVSITFNVTGLRKHDTAAGMRGSLASIAVLPFSNRSSDPDNQYFADGLHDDLLTRLADIRSLRVISRTSVNEYRDTAKDLPRIGEELGVAAVVLGAVQRSGDTVRITVQLFDAANDEHLWSDSYDRELTARNVFDIQSEISAQIAAALRTALTPEEALRLSVMPTNSIQALSLYSKARNNLYLRRLDTLREARRQFERAIEVDPDYAQAYAGLAETLLVLLSNHNAIAPHEAFRLSDGLITRALQIDDQLAEAHAARGLLEFYKWRVTRVGNGNSIAEASFQRAITLNPNLANAYVWFASLREAEQRFGDAVNLLATAMQIDPLSRIPYVNLPNLYSMQGEFDKATALLVKSMDIFEDWPSPYAYMANHLKSLGRLDEAVAWARLAQAMSDDPMSAQGAVPVYIEFGDVEQMRRFIDQFPEDHPLYPIGQGFLHFMHNEMNEAIASLEHYPAGSDVGAGIVYPLLSAAALVLRDYDRAEDFLLRGNPLLDSDTSSGVDRYNVKDAILLAYILQQKGDRSRSSELLSEAWEVIQDMPRLGSLGHGISDVHILAIRGQKAAALDALRNAIDEGFVSLIAFDLWTLDQDVLVDSLRNEPRFQAMLKELHGKIEIMRENVRQAEESGNWDPLLNRVRPAATASLSASRAASALRP